MFPNDLLCSSKEPVTVSVENPEWDVLRWSQYKNLHSIELLFRRIGDLEWNSALNPTGGRIYIPIRVPEVRLA